MLMTNNSHHCRYGSQLEGLALSDMNHVTDALWNAYLPKLVNAKILVGLFILKHGNYLLLR